MPPVVHLSRASSMERIIVRRGRYQAYGLLRRTFRHDSNIEVIWDRRGAAQGRGGDAHVERRGRPSVEWNQSDYIFTSGRRPDPLIGKRRS